MTISTRSLAEQAYLSKLAEAKKAITGLLELEQHLPVHTDIGGIAAISITTHLATALADRVGSKVIDSRLLAPYFIPTVEQVLADKGYQLEYNPFKRTELSEYTLAELSAELYKRTNAEGGEVVGNV